MELLKEKILLLAIKHGACSSQFLRCKNAGDERELLQVVKDNFTWCYFRKVITTELLNEFSSELLIEFGIYHKGVYPKIKNLKGIILCGNVKVDALENSTVSKMWENSTVSEMWENSTVSEMLGNSTVKIYGANVKDPKIVRDNFCIINLSTKEIYCSNNFKVKQ